MAISAESKARIVKNISNTRALCLKKIPDLTGTGDYALVMIALAISNVAETMLESQEVRRVSVVSPIEGETPIIGGAN